MVPTLTLRPRDHPSTPEAATGYLTAATGERCVTITAYGHQPDMGEPDRRAAAREDLRRQLKRDLGPYRTHLKEVLEHIDHMDQVDLDRLQHVLVILQGKESAGRGEILKTLQSIHDDEQCQVDMEREGLLEPEPGPEQESSWGWLKRRFPPPRE